MSQKTQHELPDYHLGDLLFRGSTSVYRARRNHDGRPVVLKFLGAEYPSPEEIARFRHEFELTRKLSDTGVIAAYDLLAYRSSMVMVLEDFGGMALNETMPMPLDKFLRLAIAIGEIIGAIHRRGIIHKNITPANLLSAGENVKLIDLGIATELTFEEFDIKSTHALEGTLEYLSPEQTGRMNRALDYRTDLYSLGATLYHLLTGRAPFTEDEPIELIHCHLARMPIPPADVRPEIPATLSAIIMKLLAKMAEDRYQSAAALVSDLRLCQERLEREGPGFEAFPIARDDVSVLFRIPEKLYGREAELERLLSAFERMSVSRPGDPLEVVTVSGYSGIGKSMLVNEIHRPITRRRGYFISGKFDQFQRNKPYASIIESFRELLGQILTESDERIEFWRDHLRAALGPNGQVVIDVLPELELIIGKQPPVPELSPKEAQNRFNLTFQNFVMAFTPPEHPLVCFLDDLQWADTATLELLEYLLTGKETIHLLLIIAYRDNEVDPSHPTIGALEKIARSGTRISSILLRPLSLEHVRRLLADTLHCSPSEAGALAEVLVDKTEGNPFFLKQYLHRIHKDGMIRFNEVTRAWHWDAAEIARMEIASNVVDLMVQKIGRLTGESRELLKRAACIGTQFDLGTIAIVSGSPAHLTARSLWPALEEGLILPSDDNYKLVGETSEDIQVSYRFLHDRIQQAAYSLVPEAERADYHLEIGRLLFRRITGEERTKRIFDIVNQLNAGIDLIDDPAERVEYAGLNLIAGRQARGSAAYASAREYLKHGIDFVGPHGWRDHYEIMLGLHVDAAEAAYLSGHFEELERLAGEIDANARNLLDRVKAYEIRIARHVYQNQFLEAIQMGLEALRLLGEPVPRKPSHFHLLYNLIRTRFMLGRMSKEDHINLPRMSDPFQRAAQRILNRVGPASYYAAPDLIPAMLFKYIQIPIQHGHTELSPFAYSSYAMALCGPMRDYDQGEIFGEIAKELIDRYDARETEGRTLLILPFIIQHWKNPLRAVSEFGYEDAIQICVETGDLEFAGNGAFCHAFMGFYWGQELEGLADRLEKSVAFCRKIKHAKGLNWTRTYQQACANLQGHNDDPARMSGQYFNKEDMREIMRTDLTGTFYVHLTTLHLGYLFGSLDLDAAVEGCEASIGGHLASYHSAFFPFILAYKIMWEARA